MTTFTLLITISTGLTAGFLSGLMGVGGGTITVPAMVFFLGLSQHLAQGISLAVIIPTAMIGAYGYWLKKNANMTVALLLASGAVFGSVAGVNLACALPPDQLKKVFGIFAIMVAIKVLYDVFSKQK